LAGNDFAGRVVLITGGSSGIGETTALAFAKAGAAVAVLARREDQLTLVVNKIRALGADVCGVVGDVRKAEDCKRAVAETVAAFGGLDVVFCNAGVFRLGNIEDTSEDNWNLQMDVILKGTFLTCKYAVGALRDRGGGTIILSGSNCSHVGCSGRFAYTAAKAAMPLLALQLSNDYFKSANIRVNCVSPGYVRTPMSEQQWEEEAMRNPHLPDLDSLSANWQPADAVATGVLFLASDAASHITGVTLPISDGMLIHDV
jgi:NAD(P)-dependent dehydrogenase (short-subunit alcohol dehydrogenase family)